jgi:hypothetical protein
MLKRQRGTDRDERHRRRGIRETEGKRQKRTNGEEETERRNREETEGRNRGEIHGRRDEGKETEGRGIGGEMKGKRQRR